MDPRVVFAVIGLLALVGATLFMIGHEIVAPNLKGDMLDLAIIGVMWTISIPNIGRLRKMIADQKLDRK